jgi:hypothetical protein
MIDQTKSIRPGFEVVVWRVDIAFLTKEHWKYEGSKAGNEGGGRTHTFGVREPAKVLRSCVAYQLPNIVVSGGKPTLTGTSGRP